MSLSLVEYSEGEEEDMEDKTLNAVNEDVKQLVIVPDSLNPDLKVDSNGNVKEMEDLTVHLIQDKPFQTELTNETEVKEEADKVMQIEEVKFYYDLDKARVILLTESPTTKQKSTPKLKKRATSAVMKSKPISKFNEDHSSKTSVVGVPSVPKRHRGRKVSTIPSGNKVQCKICKNFYHNYYLTTHMTVHSGEKLCPCLICANKYKTIHSAITHMKKSHSEDVDVISYKERLGSHSGSDKQLLQSKTNPSKGKLKGILETSINQPAYQEFLKQIGNKIKEKKVSRPKPRSKVKTEKVINEETSKQTENNAFVEVFEENPKSVTGMVTKAIKGGLYICSYPKCGKSFKCSRNFQYHSYIHSGEKPFECKICKKRFNQPGTLATHENIHQGVTPFKCPYCPKRCRLLCNLRVHVRGVHGKVMEPSRRKKSRLGLQPSHNVLIKRGRKPKVKKELFEVNPSEVSYTIENQIQTSVPSIAPKEESIFEVTELKSSDTEVEAVKTNLKPHLKYREMTSCKKCGKSFSYIWNLKRHMNVVHGKDKRPFKCLICGGTFVKAFNLAQHMTSTHTDQKPLEEIYTCLVCPQRFATIKNVEFHLKRAHGLELDVNFNKNLLLIDNYD